MSRFLLCCFFFVSYSSTFSLRAQEPNPPNTPPRAPIATRESPTDNRQADYVRTINFLRERVLLQDKRIEVQQNDINDLKAALAEIRTMLAGKLKSGPGTAAEPSPPNLTPQPSPSPSMGEKSPEVAEKRDLIAPLSIRIGGAILTPLGFVDMTYATRSKNVGSGIATNFGDIPQASSAQGQLSESLLSFENSRIGFRFDSKVGNQQVLGYFEADFVGSAPSGARTYRNNAPLGGRSYWLDFRSGPIEILGGQEWSLLTPNRKGLSPIPSDIFYTNIIDPNYQVGLLWARVPQARFIYHLPHGVAAGISIEHPDQFIGSFVDLPKALSDSYSRQFDVAGVGTGFPAPLPDIVAKLAFDGGPPGRTFHFEFGGISRSFHAFNPLTMKEFSTSGGGASIGANIEIYKNLRLITNSYAGAGGRNLLGLAPDLIVRSDGSLSPVKSAATLDGFELFLRRTTNIYGYYGGAYFRRNIAVDTGGQSIGFGSPSSSTNATRSLQEATIGISQRLWGSPPYGALALGFQYSYVSRTFWNNPSNPTNTDVHMSFANLRYILP